MIEERISLSNSPPAKTQSNATAAGPGGSHLPMIREGSSPLRGSYKPAHETAPYGSDTIVVAPRSSSNSRVGSASPSKDKNISQVALIAGGIGERSPRRSPVKSPGKREGFEDNEFPSPGVSLAQLNEVISMNLDRRVLTKGKLNSELSTPAGSPQRAPTGTSHLDRARDAGDVAVFDNARIAALNDALNYDVDGNGAGGVSARRCRLQKRK